jgi:hypothetical protein
VNKFPPISPLTILQLRGFMASISSSKVRGKR